MLSVECFRKLSSAFLSHQQQMFAREHGFEPIDILHLLRLRLDDATCARIDELAAATDHTTRPLRTWPTA